MTENVILDLSHWEENVNFKLVKEDGLCAIIHKATQGLNYVDPKYRIREKATEQEGLLWGAYHFGVCADGKSQAEHFLNIVRGSSKVLLALDIEDNNGNNITLKQAEDFVNRVHEATGRLPLIYGSSHFLNDFDTQILKKCPLWIARWGPEPILPVGWNNWILWQYTDGYTGPEPHLVKGIGPCDRDIFNGTLEELKKFWLSTNSL